MRWASLIVVAASFACGGDTAPTVEGGAQLYVLFDERHDLQGGELVRLHEFDIGFIEAVGLSGGRVRAELSLSPESLGNINEATTFSVELGDDGLRYLETHVLDPDAPQVSEGATLDGVDSALELTMRQAGASQWWRKASELVDDLKKGIDEVDWKKEEEALRERGEKLVEELDQLAEEGSEEFGTRVQELIRELEEAGRSEEAQKLRERFEKLMNDTLGNEEPSQ